MSQLDYGAVRAIVAKLVRARIGRRAADPEMDPDFDAHFSERERRELVAQAVYELAAARDFEPGEALDDWLAAEAVVDHELRAWPRGR